MIEREELDPNERQKLLLNKLDAITTLLINRFSLKEYVRDILTTGRTKSGKKKAIRAFNALTGNKNITEVEQTSGMDHSTLIQALEQWENEGIIFLHHKEGRSKYYKHLFPLSNNPDT